MSKKNYFALSGVVFAAVFVLHFLRLLNKWDAVIGGWTVPMWISWLALFLAGFLAWSAFKGTKR